MIYRAFVVANIAGAYQYYNGRLGTHVDNTNRWRFYDYDAKKARIQERGVVHLAENGQKYASWQEGYETQQERLETEMGIIEEHIAEHGIEFGKYGWETPFNKQTI